MKGLRTISFLFLMYCCLPVSGQIANSKEVKLMGCRFVIRAVALNESQSWKAIEAGISEIERIEKLISSWDPKSQTSEVNRNAGLSPVSVDQELFDLVSRALKISQLTQGAFDISYASMDRIYQFDGSEKLMPSLDVVQEARSKIGWERIALNSETNSIFLKDKGMKIGFGAIGKGYAANQAKKVMETMEGVLGGIVNASGDLMIWGTENNVSQKWNIKISDPQNIDQTLADIDVSNCAVVTSGDYEKYFTSGGVRYAHIIDPKSGYPTSGIKSVTIICPDAELADALATSVFVLGKKDGLFLVNQLKGVEAIIVTDDNEILKSENISLNYY